MQSRMPGEEINWDGRKRGQNRVCRFYRSSSKRNCFFGCNFFNVFFVKRNNLVLRMLGINKNVHNHLLSYTCCKIELPALDYNVHTIADRKKIAKKNCTL